MRTLLLLLLFSLNLVAQSSVTSPPMGYVQLELQGKTDNHLALPLLPEAVGLGHVVAVTANTLTLDNSNWNIGQYMIAICSINCSGKSPPPFCPVKALP